MTVREILRLHMAETCVNLGRRVIWDMMCACDFACGKFSDSSLDLRLHSMRKVDWSPRPWDVWDTTKERVDNTVWAMHLFGYHQEGTWLANHFDAMEVLRRAKKADIAKWNKEG